MHATLQGPSGLIQLDQTILTIGRSRQNRLILTHPRISARHAEIRPLGEGRYQIIDVGSMNSTSVNGLRLIAGTPYLLHNGDTVLLGGVGGVELVFAYSAATAPEAPLPEPLLAASPVPAPGAWLALPDGSPLASPLPPQAPGGLFFPAGGTAPGFPPAPAPLPAAITTGARSKRPPRLLLVGGSLLVLVLLVVGIGLGGKLLGRSFAHPYIPVTINTPRPTTAPSIVQTGSVTIQGQSTTVLTTTTGRTLYYFTPDTATTTACTGACATTWPPLLLQGAGTPTAATTLPGTLGIQTSANGAQVAYNGHPLYTFSGDTASGQANGQGKGGKWFVATPTLAVQS